MKNWKSQIGGCFGSSDNRFANHPADRQHAAKMLESAIRQGASYKDFCKETRTWLSKKLGNKNPQVVKRFVDTEMRKVRKVATYFP